MDEVDTIFGPKAPDNEGIRGVLDNGYTRGKPYLRCVGEGSRQRVEPFAVFGPKMLCGIGGLPDTIADRCLPVRLKRRFRLRDGEHFGNRGPKRRRNTGSALGMGDQALDKLAEADRTCPVALDGRAQDVCEPLGNRRASRRGVAAGPQGTGDSGLSIAEDDEAIGIRLLIDIGDVSVRRQITAFAHSRPSSR
jgi:hypothetical protein